MRANLCMPQGVHHTKFASYHQMILRNLQESARQSTILWAANIKSLSDWNKGHFRSWMRGKEVSACRVSIKSIIIARLANVKKQSKMRDYRSTAEYSSLWWAVGFVVITSGWSCVVTCSVRVGGLSHLFVRVEFRLGCYDGGKFLGCLLRGDGNTCTTQRWSSLHPGCHLSRLVISVPWVPHGPAEERQNIFRAEVPKQLNYKMKKQTSS